MTHVARTTPRKCSEQRTTYECDQIGVPSCRGLTKAVVLSAVIAEDTYKPRGTRHFKSALTPTYAVLSAVLAAYDCNPRMRSDRGPFLLGAHKGSHALRCISSVCL